MSSRTVYNVSVDVLELLEDIWHSFEIVVSLCDYFVFLVFFVVASFWSLASLVLEV